MKSNIPFIYLIKIFLDFHVFQFNMFRIEIIDHIIKFGAFLEMWHYVKFENIKMFFFVFLFKSLCSRKTSFQIFIQNNAFFKQLNIKLSLIEYWINKTKFTIVLIKWTIYDFSFVRKEIIINIICQITTRQSAIVHCVIL